MAASSRAPSPPTGYLARPARLEDAEAVARVIAACEDAYNLGTTTTTADIRDEWREIDLDEETVVVEDAAGPIVASADIVNRFYAVLNAYGYVHPEQEGKGLGRHLVEWGERWALDRMHRAEPDVQVVVRHFVNAENASALALFAACGYEAVRNTYVMRIDLNEPPPAPEWPEGITQAEYRPGIDERDVFEATEDAFRDNWGYPPSSFERFLTFSQGDSVKPDLWILARTGSEVAGVCLGTLTDEHGWIPTVGVRRAWRRKGLGLALLHAGFGAYYRRGVTDVRLSVDAQSLTGASRLYERAGMRVISHYILHQKILREGVDIGVSLDGE
jgi:GNAT superfamily N-acetyltransferase